MKRLGLQLFTFLMVLSMLSLSVAVADVNLPSWSSFPLLQNGDDEKAVRAVRVIAKYYNPSSIGVSTTFDTATENAVKKFQKNYGFSKNDQDGIVGPQTWNAMHSVLGQKTQITGGGTGNGTPSSSGGYWGYKVYQHSVGSYTRDYQWLLYSLLRNASKEVHFHETPIACMYRSSFLLPNY